MERDDGSIQKKDATPPHLRKADDQCGSCEVFWRDHQSKGVFHHEFSPKTRTNEYDFMARSIKRRQKAWINEWRQLQNDVDHWNRTHPDEEPLVIEPIIAAEIVEGLPR